jgi:ABC-type lipoprotein export system ATPase subunit
VLRCTGIKIAYRTGRVAVPVLDDVSLQVEKEPVALMGPSGSGKSSLLRVLAGLQAPQAGTVVIDGKPVRAARDRGTTDPRVALIQQDHRLVDFLTVAENLRLAAELRGLPVTAADVSASLAEVGLDGYASRWPATLSGGEQQRVAIARALLLESRVILADEPTGALDADNSLLVAGLLAEIAQRDGVCVVVATHDADVAARLPRRLRLTRGRLQEQAA